MTKLFLHLGYPKTGTTTLQQSVFEPLHSAGHIRYLGMGGYGDETGDLRRRFFMAVQEALYLEDEAAFDAALPGLQDALRKLSAHVPGAAPLVLSNEHFLLSNWSSREKGLRIWPARSAARLGRVCAGMSTGLLIGTRERADLVRSVYVQMRSNKAHVNYHRFAPSLEAYIDHICARADFSSQMFSFDENRNHYASAFPGAPWLELPFEDIQSNQRALVEKLFSFLGLTAPALSVLEFPLAHSNAKSKTETGTRVVRFPRFLRPIARNDAISPALRRISRVSPFKYLRKALMPSEEIPDLTPAQRQKIEKAFAH